MNNFKQLKKWLIYISDVHTTNFTYGQIPFNDVVIILITDADLRFIFINFNIELFNILLLFLGLFVEKMLPNWNSASNKQLVAHRAVTSTGGNLTIVITALFTYRRLPVCGGSPGSPAVPLVLVGRR